MRLEQVEQNIQRYLDRLEARRIEGFERPSMDEWLRAYEVLAQVRQAQASERIADRLDDIGKDMSAVNSSDL